MTDKIIDLKEYIVKLQRLREEAEQEKEETKRNMIIAICDWFDLKVEEWKENYMESETAFDKLEQSKDKDLNSSLSENEQQIMRDYLTQLTMAGRLFYIYHAIEILKSEGEDWENNRSSIKAVLTAIFDGWRE
jgi:hypothetical protein